jgi:DNA repair exonuclease SbcCD nuclease subunit
VEREHEGGGSDGQVGLVVHAADLHLGAPLRSLGRRIDPAHAARLRERSTLALERLVDLAVDRSADAMVLAGDVYDGADREVAAQLRFGRALRRLTEHGIRVFIAHGNHDPVVDGHRPALPLPEGVTVFAAGPPQHHEVPLRSGGSFPVVGTSFGVAHERENLAARFAGLAVEPTRCVAVLHANVEGSTGHDPYAPCTLADLEHAPVGYWALGHVHQRRVEPLGGAGSGRWWAYPGNLQGRSSARTECGPKGALVVPLTRAGIGEPAFVACDTVRFERVDVAVDEAGDLGTALDLVAAAAEGCLERVGDRPLLLRPRLLGATSAHHALVDAGDDLLDLARDHLGGLLGEGALVGVDHATHPLVARAQLLERGDLLAALLARLDELRGTDEPVLPMLEGQLDRATLAVLAELEGREPGLRALLLDRVEELLVHAMVAP